MNSILANEAELRRKREKQIQEETVYAYMRGEARGWHLEVVFEIARDPTARLHHRRAPMCRGLLCRVMCRGRVGT
jgi:hypothetical protein